MHSAQLEQILLAETDRVLVTVGLVDSKIHFEHSQVNSVRTRSVDSVEVLICKINGLLVFVRDYRDMGPTPSI